MSLEDKIKKTSQIPCGAVNISADSVCRRGLRTSMDRLLDRLAQELHPTTLPDKAPKGFSGSETESLQGNSKMLQDVSGKIKPW